MKLATVVLGYPRNESPVKITTHVLIQAFSGLSGEIRFTERYFTNEEELNKALKALAYRNAVFYTVFGLMPECVVFSGTIAEYMLWQIEISQ
jgi:phosphatidylserine/phosphatidylglycerophosphate/cardiolipin synthase-like enzyme